MHTFCIRNQHPQELNLYSLALCHFQYSEERTRPLPLQLLLLHRNAANHIMRMRMQINGTNANAQSATQKEQKHTQRSMEETTQADTNTT